MIPGGMKIPVPRPVSRFDFEVRGSGFQDVVDRAHARAVAFWGGEYYTITRLDAHMGNLAAHMDGTVDVMDYHADVTTVLDS